ncbi:hypothetical protein [Halobacteriovorax sp. DPLXC-1]|uniref:hypothetical protein n=1 Tax=Halobacteriovorax sp. DPLXC-1 TaxID=3110771 RepID=UPI002FEF8DC5
MKNCVLFLMLSLTSGLGLAAENMFCQSAFISGGASTGFRSLQVEVVEQIDITKGCPQYVSHVDENNQLQTLKLIDYRKYEDFLPHNNCFYAFIDREMVRRYDPYSESRRLYKIRCAPESEITVTRRNETIDADVASDLIRFPYSNENTRNYINR